MSQEMTIHGETLCASQEKALTVELYLQDRFEFRSNVLNGKVEFRCKGKTDDVFRPLTERVQNSIVLNLLREDVCEEGNPQSLVKLYLNSEEVEVYDPIRDYLEHLPQWDGRNYVAEHYLRASRLLGRLAPFSSCPLVAAGYAARQRVCAHTDRQSGMWQDDLPASPAASAPAPVLSGPPEPLEQVRQGDGADQQPAGEPRRTGCHPSNAACCPEADALEEQGERTPHLRCLARGQGALCLVRGDDE